MLTGKVRKDNPVGSFNKVLQLCSELGTIDMDKYQGGNYMKQLLQSSYFINEEGLVFNKQMKEVKRDSSNGGIIVNINLESKRKKYPIWKLMAKTYFDMQEDEIFNIKDGDTTNTNLSNYEVLKLDKIGKRIKGFEDYIVTKEGEIFSTKYGRLQKVATYYDSNGYEMVKLCKENKVTIVPSLETESIGIILDFVSNATDMIGFSTKSFIEKDLKTKNIKILKTDFEITPREICVFNMKDRIMANSSRMFLSELETYFASVKE